jgi:hypothetical protein
MNNLAKYNNDTSGNGLTGFISSVWDRIEKSWKQFTDLYDGPDGEGGIKNYIKKAMGSWSTASTDRVMNTAQDDTIKIDIKKEIEDTYIETKSLIW